MTASADLVGSFGSGTPEWHALRATGIGGSDIATVLGLNPWESAFSLWHRKTGLIGDKVVSREMSWGHYHEDTIARWYRDTHPGTRVARTGTWRNRARPWQLANPDRLLTGRRVLEIKTDRTSDGWGQSGTDDIPVYYRAQILWYIDTLGWDVAHLAVLIGGSDPREYVIPWSQDETDLMRDAAEKFWASLRSGQRPDLDGHDATYRVVRDLNPDLDDTEAEVPADLAQRYWMACAAEKTVTTQKRAAVSELLDRMGRARRAVCEGQRIAIRVPGRNGAPPSLRPNDSKPTGQRIEAAA